MMVVACRESRHLSAPRVAPPDLAIVDARNDATRTGFYFLAPIRPISFPPPWSGTFDAGLSPVVEICELNAGACVLPPVSRLTMTDGLEIDRVHVFPGLQEYN